MLPHPLTITQEQLTEITVILSEAQGGIGRGSNYRRARARALVAAAAHRLALLRRSRLCEPAWKRARAARVDLPLVPSSAPLCRPTQPQNGRLVKKSFEQHETRARPNAPRRPHNSSHAARSIRASPFAS